jgi:membrane-associated phospholipid phosphatase
VKQESISIDKNKNDIATKGDFEEKQIVKNKTGFNLFALFSPLDVATILYIAVSGIYLCFGILKLDNVLLHFVSRLVALSLIFCISYANQKYPNKFISFFKNLYPVFFLSFFYTETGYLKNIVFPDNFDIYFVRAEQWLWSMQPSLEFARLMPQEWFNEFMNVCYFSYYALISAICIIIYFDKKPHSDRSIFIIIFSFYLYYVFYALVPVEGPQFYFNTLYTDADPPYFFGKVMRYILTNLERPTGAFPSSHVGIALIISIILFKDAKKYFYYSLLFLFGICFATIYLKAHYIVDVFGAVVTAPLLIATSSYVYTKLNTVFSTQTLP